MIAKNISQTDELASAPHPGGPNLRQRILVVEDDAAIRRLNTEILTQSGYHVDAAEDGAAAWDALQKNNYDLLVTDNDMPKVTGVELLQKVQAAGMALPVIMATGAAPEFNDHGSRQPDATLLKPYTFHELVSAVKEVLGAASVSFEGIALPPHWNLKRLTERFRL